MIKTLKRIIYTASRYLPWKTNINPATVSHEAAWKFFKKRDKYYTELLDAVTPLIEKQTSIIDVGANIGYFTFTLFERYGFTGKADFFEPVSHLNSLCVETFKGKGYDVIIHPFALGMKNETSKIFLAADGNIGWNTLVAGKAGRKMQEETITVRRFDDLEIPLPGFIKIDVEGAEWMVLEGMMEKLTAAAVKPVILCELGWGNKHPQFDEVMRIFSELKGLGYQTFDLRREPIDVTLLTETTDILLMPK